MAFSLLTGPCAPLSKIFGGRTSLLLLPGAENPSEATGLLPHHTESVVVASQ